MLCLIFQRYKSKANHNWSTHLPALQDVVLDISKIQIESKSQQFLLNCEHSKCCAWYFKDTNRKQITTDRAFIINTFVLCLIFQRYKSKANHNIFQLFNICWLVVLDISKIQIESKSQQVTLPQYANGRCAWYFKDTNRKQITTVHILVLSFR